MEIVERNALEEVDDQQLFEGAMDGMMGSLGRRLFLLHAARRAEGIERGTRREIRRHRRGNFARSENPRTFRA